MTDTIDIHALAGAYALDAVDDIERAAFDRHLRGCSACALEVRELRETTAWLTHSVASTPPVNLRNNVLAAVARTPQDRARHAAAPSPASTKALIRWRRFTAAAVAASILALGVGAATWSVGEQRLTEAQEQVRNAQANSQRMEQVISAADATVVRGDLSTGGQVSLIVSKRNDAALAVMSGLAEAGDGKVYQLWMIPANDNARKISVGTMKTDGSQFIAGLQEAPRFGVSIEPEGGSDQPTHIVATVELSLDS